MPDVLLMPRGIGCYPVGARVYAFDGELVEVVGAYGLQKVADNGATSLRMGYVCRKQGGEVHFYRAAALSEPDGAGYLQRVK